MTTDTLTRAAELLEVAAHIMWSGAASAQANDTAARLREMAASDQSARIAELEEAVKYWLVVDMERQARIAELEDAAQRALSDRDRFRTALADLARIADTRPFAPIAHVIERGLGAASRLSIEAALK